MSRFHPKARARINEQKLLESSSTDGDRPQSGVAGIPSLKNVLSDKPSLEGSDVQVQPPGVATGGADGDKSGIDGKSQVGTVTLSPPTSDLDASNPSSSGTKDAILTENPSQNE